MRVSDTFYVHHANAYASSRHTMLRLIRLQYASGHICSVPTVHAVHSGPADSPQVYTSQSVQMRSSAALTSGLQACPEIDMKGCLMMSHTHSGLQTAAWQT